MAENGDVCLRPARRIPLGRLRQGRSREAALEVIVPSMRPAGIDRLLYSFAEGTVRPRQITIVSNEVERVAARGMNVRIVHFRTSAYVMGRHDVTLRRNIGIWNAAHERLMMFDDDQIAPAALVDAATQLLRTRHYFWGNHRFIDLAGHTVDEVIHGAADLGEPRDRPNRWNLWHSCYGGLLGARRRTLIQIGGFDMIYNGWIHSYEDQNLGRRLARHLDNREVIWTYEPPFAWHPTEKAPFPAPAYCNACPPDEHDLVEANLALTAELQVQVQRCLKCPFAEPMADVRCFDHPVVVFDPSKVEIQVVAGESGEKLFEGTLNQEQQKTKPR